MTWLASLFGRRPSRRGAVPDDHSQHLGSADEFHGIGGLCPPYAVSGDPAYHCGEPDPKPLCRGEHASHSAWQTSGEIGPYATTHHILMGLWGMMPSVAVQHILLGFRGMMATLANLNILIVEEEFSGYGYSYGDSYGD